MVRGSQCPPCETVLFLTTRSHHLGQGNEQGQTAPAKKTSSKTSGLGVCKAPCLSHQHKNTHLLVANTIFLGKGTNPYSQSASQGFIVVSQERFSRDWGATHTPRITQRTQSTTGSLPHLCFGLNTLPPAFQLGHYSPGAPSSLEEAVNPCAPPRRAAGEVGQVLARDFPPHLQIRSLIFSVKGSASFLHVQLWRKAKGRRKWVKLNHLPKCH